MRSSSRLAIALLTGLLLTFFAGGYLARSQSIGGGSVTQAQLDAVIAAMPQPYTGVPLGPNAAGVTANNNLYVPSAAQQRQAVQRTVSTTDASGNFAVTWNTTFLSSTPTVTVTAGNPSGPNGIICNWQTRSSSNVTGKCWQTNTALIALLGITITIAPTAPATNTPISVIMAEPTQ